MVEPAYEVFKAVFTAILLSVGSPGEAGVIAYNATPIFCMAQNIYFEAGNQDWDGKVSVAHVTLNRVDHPNYPNSVCEVVYEGPTYTNWKGNEMPVRWNCQFTWYCDGKSDNVAVKYKPNKDAWIESIEAAVDAVINRDDDPTNGATHYHNPSLASPAWRNEFPVTAFIGEHLFQKRPES